MIDAHQHFWRLARGDYDWLTPDLTALHRDFLPDDLAPLLAAAGIRRTIVVQAAATVDETRFLLSLADTVPWIAGVVGWIPMDEPDAPAALEALARHAALVGVRPMIQDVPDPDWMLGPRLRPAFEAIVEAGLRLDALVRPEHLPNLLTLLERHPDLPVVIDHAAKPAIAAGAFDAWARDLARLAEATPAHCKLSGLVTEAAPDWRVDDLRRYVDHVIGCFGPERVLWGSDWPVVESAGGFARWREATSALLADRDGADRRAILGDAAARFYGLPALDPAE